MFIKDQIYGNQHLNSPVIEEIVNTSDFQRLHGIDLAGYYEPYAPGVHVSRYEHSMGVYLILHMYNAPLAEQIAGLIHDISHSAFSHCIDYALSKGTPKTHGHQDAIHYEFVTTKTSIPFILKKYEIDSEYILDDKNFPLKERLLPDLCADRIDYILRTAFAHGKINQEDVRYYLSDLKINNTDWVFNEYTIAKKFAELFRLMNNTVFSGLYSAVMFDSVGKYLKYALSQNYISIDNLYTTDKQVLDKISLFHQSDQHLFILWQRMAGVLKAHSSNDDKLPAVYVKSRVIDPLFIKEHKIIRLSDYDKEWKNVVIEESKPKCYRIEYAE
jgi:uncharacterized protein